jgi:hypothetical protein
MGSSAKSVLDLFRQMEGEDVAVKAGMTAGERDKNSWIAKLGRRHRKSNPGPGLELAPGNIWEAGNRTAISGLFLFHKRLPCRQDFPKGFSQNASPAHFFACTSVSALPQEHFPGFWLMVSHLQSGPQAQANFPTLTKGFVLESMVSFPFSTFVTFAFTKSFPQVHEPGFLDMVSQGQPSPQPQTKISSPTLAVILVLSAKAKVAKAREKMTMGINSFFI